MLTIESVNKSDLTQHVVGAYSDASLVCPSNMLAGMLIIALSVRSLFGGTRTADTGCETSCTA